ncbi:MAG: hypothetical protein ACD_30C00005G0024 [uncultured bacterium]|nr:MAG: hypothetical protein ACD_30C00005G0024 [uncultured bacterium]
MDMLRNFFFVLIIGFFITGIYAAFYNSHRKINQQVLPASTTAPEYLESTPSASPLKK